MSGQYVHLETMGSELSGVADMPCHVLCKGSELLVFLFSLPS